MDGLECSEVWLSVISVRSPSFRLDSHFYEKQYLMLSDKLLNRAHWMLKDIVVKPIQTGHTPSMKNINYYGGKIAFIKTDNLHANNIGVVFTDYLSESGNAVIERTTLQPNDIITTIIGATEDIIARSALILPEHIPANINQNIAQIRVNNKIALPEYVNAFLNSKYGRKYLQYFSRQTEQVNLNCQEIGLVVIPKFSKELQKAIKECTVKAYSLQQKANRLYTNSEQILLTYLNIKNYIPREQSFCVKNLSDSFNASGRLDAEYYQTKYDNLFIKLSTVKTYPLGDLVWIKKSVEPGSGEYLSDGIPFVRVSDLSKYGLSEPEIHLSRIQFAHMDLQPKKDTILFSKDGSVGIAYKVETDLDVVTSGAILHLLMKTNQFLPDYLTLVLNSQIVKMQAERDAGGSVIQHWKPAEIEKVVIPWLPLDKQEQIAEKIQTSFSLREKSKRLLEMAKQAVEMAIETDEQTALNWLDSQRKLNPN